MGTDAHLEERDGLIEAAESVWWAYDAVSNATTLVEQAPALIELSNAMSDLASWLPGYDINTGRLPGDD